MNSGQIQVLAKISRLNLHRGQNRVAQARGVISHRLWRRGVSGFVVRLVMGHVMRLVVGLDEVRRLRHVRGLRDVGRLRRAAKTKRGNFVQGWAGKIFAKPETHFQPTPVSGTAAKFLKSTCM